MKHCNNFRAKRMRAYISGNRSLLLLSLLMSLFWVASIDAVPARSSDDIYAKLDGVDEYADVDNVEWHHVKIVDGLVEEDHPIIMYKEDFVSEDFDPSNSESSSERNGTRHVPRKYKSIAHRRRNRLRHSKDDESKTHVTEKYHALKPKKMLFDVLPQTPLLADDSSAAAADAKFDPTKIRVEVISLTDDNSSNRNDDSMQIEGGDEASKQLLSKRPKKYHRRARRNAPTQVLAAGGEHVRDKRNPYYRQSHSSNGVMSAAGGGSNWVLVPVLSSQQATGLRHSIRGKLWNGLYLEVPSAGEAPARGDSDLEFGPRIGGDETATERPPRRRRPTSVNDIFHDSNPNLADMSFATQRPPASESTSSSAPPRSPPPAPSRQPPRGSESSPTAGAPVAVPRPIATTTTARPPPLRTDVAVTNCMWAIVNCCSAPDWNLRYDCFEQFSCSGAFWDLNPCADSIRENVFKFVNDVYD